MASNCFALYSSSVKEFIESDQHTIENALASGLAKHFSSVSSLSLESWSDQIHALQRAFRLLCTLVPGANEFEVLLEYSIPVLRRRIDAVLIAQGHIFVIEHKSGFSSGQSGALNQALGYAADLRDFHEASRDRNIIPVAFGASFDKVVDKERPWRGFAASVELLPERLVEVFQALPSVERLKAAEWDKSRYFPVPTIIDAAVQIYSNHGVHEIADAGSDIDNLKRISETLNEAIGTAKRDQKRILCILTGVPGAGKTLAALSAVNSAALTFETKKEQAIYLSGNLPLVNVLRAALYMDAKSRNEKTTRKSLDSLIQEMHRFAADTYRTDSPPASKVIVFDEAQRAWNAKRTLKKNSAKFGSKVDWNKSEAEITLEIASRHQDWAVVVAVVGGGQEIHDGEAGLGAWGQALDARGDWEVWAPTSAIDGGIAVAGTKLFQGKESRSWLKICEELHLDSSVRNIASQTHSHWVNLVMNGDDKGAFDLAGSGPPAYVTRSLKTAKSWLRERQVGARRCGLLSSGSAARVRAEGVEPPTFSFMRGIDYVAWFLEPAGKVQSSNQLEVALSEFEVQGLEIDYACLIWGGDIIREGNALVARKFGKSGWARNSSSSSQTINAYRVLLTRHRHGLVIFVPTGDIDDETRKPEEFDEIFNYLVQCGSISLDS